MAIHLPPKRKATQCVYGRRIPPFSLNDHRCLAVPLSVESALHSAYSHDPSGDVSVLTRYPSLHAVQKT